MELVDLYKLAGIHLGLATEAYAVLRGEAQQEVQGVTENKYRDEAADAVVTTVEILTEVAAKAINKARGTYITIESPALRQPPGPVHLALSRLLADTLKNVFAKIGLEAAAPVLVVGLGNWQATPDSLGPKVVGKMFVTRHLLQYAPGVLPAGTRPVAALAPGVLGITGIETAEIIAGVVSHLKPGLVIAIDSLAARNVTRLYSTIQIADSGIDPGSGIGNRRTALSRAEMGVPVLALGIPTVVPAAVIAMETLNSAGQRNRNLQGELGPPAIQAIISDLLAPFGGDLTVTPKEVDDLVTRTATLLAQGLNLALFPQLSPEDLAMLSA
ncbi:MAG: GPR endopeptidase [Clostridia bacterium]|nr:MAG: GPR endopeptidase [Clostridia bacterium]